MSRRATKESTSSDSGSAGGVTLAEVEGIVQNVCHKAIAAAIDVVKAEFTKLIEDYAAKLKDVERRLESVEDMMKKFNDSVLNVDDITSHLDRLDRLYEQAEHNLCVVCAAVRSTAGD